MLVLIDYIGSNNLVGKVHTPLIKKVSQECDGSKEMIIFDLCSFIPFHKSSRLPLQHHAIELLMHEAMNKALSHREERNTYQQKDSYVIT